MKKEASCYYLLVISFGLNWINLLIMVDWFLIGSLISSRLLNKFFSMCLIKLTAVFPLTCCVNGIPIVHLIVKVIENLKRNLSVAQIDKPIIANFIAFQFRD